MIAKQPAGEYTQNLFPNETETSIEGSLERIRFTSEDGSWSVVSVRRDKGGDVIAVGNLAGAAVGERLRLTGRWTTHPTYGARFQVRSFSAAKPVTLEGIEQYLGSGLVKGVGRELASRLVRRFGLETLTVIESSPERLREVEGIGPERSRQIREAWREQRDVRDLMVFLHSYGVSTSLAAKIHALYGRKARELIQENPYRLADDIPGVGFLTADRIARKLDGAADAPQRLEAGVVFTLGERREEGHTLVPRDELARGCAELLGVEAEKCAGAMDRLASRKAVVLDEGLAGLSELVKAETESAALLAALASFPARPLSVDAEAEISAFEAARGITLSARQKQAVRRACTDKVFVVTGGPGTGKTTLLSAILSVYTRAGVSAVLCAPTGRAAKRMEEAVGQEARTIHRLLEYSPQKGGFLRGAAHPLSADALIADEASMIDIELFQKLLQAIPPQCRLVLVGDKDQLPSVGPGNVLGDLIASGVVPVVHLTDVFRQSERSAIVANAHRINAGEMPSLAVTESGDFFFIERNEPEEVLTTVKELVRTRIPARFSMDPRSDIQVLTPMQRGALGAAALNRMLQDALNPAPAAGGSAEAGAGAALGSDTAVGTGAPGTVMPALPASFRVGDRVMQRHNDYTRGVYNGDIGLVESVDRAARALTVRFDDRPVSYDWADLDELSLAYACTIHKAQGSEFPAAVVVLHTQAYVLLARNLLYTAVTRGRRLTVIVGSKKALAIAVKKGSTGTRLTGLAGKLKKALPTA